MVKKNKPAKKDVVGIADIIASETSQEASGQWQATFDAITDLVSVQDKESRLVRVNKAYADILKTKPEDLIGKHCYEVLHGTSCPFDNCPHVQTMNTKKTVTEELFEPRLGVFLEVSTSPIFNEAGETTGTIHLAKDITERKKAEDDMKLRETHLQSLVSILQYNTVSIQDFLDNALNEAIKLTGSKIGYIYFYNEETMEFTLNTWSQEVMKECTITEKKTLYHLEKQGYGVKQYVNVSQS